MNTNLRNKLIAFLIAAVALVLSGLWVKWHMDYREIQVKFSSRNAEARIVDCIGRANRTIDLAVYRLNSEDVTNALVDAKSRGIDIRVVTNLETMKKADNFDELLAAGILVVGDSELHTMHSNYIVIDGEVVVIASTFDLRPTRVNADNEYAVIFRKRDLADAFRDNFVLMFNNYFGYERKGPGVGEKLVADKYSMCFSPWSDCSTVLEDASVVVDYGNVVIGEHDGRRFVAIGSSDIMDLSQNNSDYVLVVDDDGLVEKFLRYMGK